MDSVFARFDAGVKGVTVATRHKQAVTTPLERSTLSDDASGALHVAELTSFECSAFVSAGVTVNA